MARPVTLIDVMLSEKTRFSHSLDDMVAAKLKEARRFVLDAEMSGFLCDLAYAGFQDAATARRRAHKSLDWIREKARLPFPVTWIEWDQHARHRRRFELVDQLAPKGIDIVASTDFRKASPSLDGIDRNAGWLLWQDEESRFSCAIVWGNIVDRVYMVLPIGYTWRTDAEDLPGAMDDERSIEAIGMAVTGIPGFATRKASFIAAREFSQDALISVAKELAGELRYVWSFLSTLNQLPVTVEPRAGVGGYMARRGYHKYLGYSIIHLKIPGKRDKLRLARTMIAISRRARHEVRGHWRVDYHHPERGKSLWIEDHERGDATLGFVKHDYSVEHDKEKTP